MEYWIKIGCFVTGYNYSILKNCSEVSRKTVKRYSAAIIIMCTLWGLIGFTFASRYLHASQLESLASSILFIIIIVQVERQIILQTHKNKALHNFRALIAIMMALLGSLIIDQMIFKDDIELEKEVFINNKVERIYPERAKIRENQINDFKKQILQKDSQRTALVVAIEKSPFVPVTSSQINPFPVTKTKMDTTTGKEESITTYENRRSTSITQAPNPNINLLSSIDSQVNSIQRLMLAQSDSLANLRQSIEKSLKQRTGFMDELDIMVSLLSKSGAALVVYLIWFLLLLGLEFLVLMNKRHEIETDYDIMIKHQMQMHIHKLNLLSGK